MGNLIAYFNNNKAGSVQNPFKTPLKLLHFGNSSTSSGNLKFGCQFMLVISAEPRHKTTYSENIAGRAIWQRLTMERE